MSNEAIAILRQQSFFRKNESCLSLFLLCSYYVTNITRLIGSRVVFSLCIIQCIERSFTIFEKKDVHHPHDNARAARQKTEKTNLNKKLQGFREASIISAITQEDAIVIIIATFMSLSLLLCRTA